MYVETDGCPYNEIDVLYAMQYPGNDFKTPLPHLIAKTLNDKGIFNNWVSRDLKGSVEKMPT